MYCCCYFANSMSAVVGYFLFGNNIPSNLDNGTWASFFGSYLGAIIGGLISLIGIGITILFTQNQNKEDRELQIRPYFDFMYNQTDTPIAYKKEFICHTDHWGIKNDYGLSHCKVYPL